MALTAYKNWAQTNEGDVVGGATITVRRKADSSFADLFEDAAGTTPKLNPFTMGVDDQFFEFFIEPDRYEITVSSVASGGATVPLDIVDARENLTFDTLAEYEAWVDGGGFAPDGAVVTVGNSASGVRVQFVADSSAAIDGLKAGWRPYGYTQPDHFLENTTPGTTLMHTAINAAVQYVKGLGGGEVRFSALTYLINTTILIDRNIFLVGEGWYFVNDFIDNEAVVRGSIIKQAAGADVDVVLIRSDQADNTGGSFPRIHAGLRNIAVHGNRSELQAPSAVDLNSVGRGVVCSGVSYVTLDNVLAFRCPEVGIDMESHDYLDGNGVRSCNNMNWRNVVSTGNAGNGFDLFGGDSTFSQLVAGYNNGIGIRSNAGPIVGARVWNNQEAGVSISGSMTFADSAVYDNGHNGVNISGENVILDGCRIYDNGRKETGIDTQESGIGLQSGADHVTISGCFVGQEQNTTQHRGLHSNVSGINVTLGPNSITGNQTVDIDLTDYTTVSMHGETGSDIVRHPGFTLTGDINQAGNIVTDDGAQKVFTPTSSNVFNANTDGAVWLVTVAHIGGNAAGTATILGDVATPIIITQDTGGSTNITFTVSGTVIQAATASGSLTCNWSIMRIV